MSASDKKKLRKEQNAAAMTEKQLKEMKEAKKLKAYTISFVVAMILVVAIILGVTLRTPVAGIIDRNTNAITVGSHKVSTTELSYFYVDAINSFVNQFSDYGDYATLYMQMMGLDPSTPLSEQITDQATGKTWADYFIENAKSNAQWTYAMYEAAEKAGYTLSAEDLESIESLKDSLELYASYYGYSTGASYLRSVYGDGANLSTYKEYVRVTTIATSYANDYYDSLEYTDADFREYEKDKMNEYNSYNYALYRINSSSYLTYLGLGTVTTDEDGNETTTYSDAEKQQALDAALADAKALIAEGITDLDKLNEAINKLAINIAPMGDLKDSETGEDTTETEETENTEAENTEAENTEAEDTESTEAEDTETESEAEYEVTATEGKNVLYSSVLDNSNEAVQQWLSDSTRKEGDVTYVEISTGEDDDKVVTGYYVVMYLGVNKNEYHAADVQHILIKFEGGTEDSDGNTIYTDAEKNAAKVKAQEILDEFLKAGKIDSEAFGTLAQTKSEDTGSAEEGGLISGIHNDAGYVTAFTEWALQEHQVGDTGLIETEYGWHIMFYKGAAELTYRDSMIEADLIERDYAAWEESIMNTLTVTDHNLNGINRDLVISG